MKQLVQTLKNGKIQMIEVPEPIITDGMILVKNQFSLISPGTEGTTVSTARKTLIGKAIERPQQVKQVMEILKQQGPVQTYRTAKQKLDAYSPLGYSSAGRVVDVASDIKGFSVDDLVACGGGGYAHHADIVTIPYNLCVKLPQDVDLKKAAYNTMGAIALQGVRQADLQVGETCVVIGLGLIGQLTALILNASGIKVVGIDINLRMIEIAREHCVDSCFKSDEPGLVQKIEQTTGGIGADAVIITAASKSLDPINLAGKLARKKGKIIVVGDVPTGFDREDYYKKELELKMSCSYGPGRYDINYEEKGIDYPVGYVRWTEKRNMEAFQELIHSKRINIDFLTTHIFDIEDAPKAYDLILRKEEPYLGILLRYSDQEVDQKKKIIISDKSPSGKVSISFIGVGDYANNYLLPNIPKNKDVVLKGVMDSVGSKARRAAEKYGFEFCTHEEDEILKNEEINTIFIATQHNSHADYVIKALKAGKNVWVEKPLCIKESELEKIKEVCDSFLDRSDRPALSVGFNRRFSPLTEIIKKHFSDGPMAMTYRINAGDIAHDSWIQDRELGGGRIIGEVCHFVDYLTFLNGSLPDFVFASSMPNENNTDDTITINMKFKNGSVGTISYFSNGAKSLFKEYVEIYKTGITGVLKDFKELEIYSDRKTYKKRMLVQDKGQKKMIEAFVDGIREGAPPPIEFEDIYAATLATFKIIESIHKRKVISINNSAS